MVKLIKIIPAKNKKKKWTAFFDLGEKDKKGKPKEKAVSLGSKGMREVTLRKDKASTCYEKDKKQREKVKNAYRARHAKDNLTDPMSPGSLSWHILWSSPSFAGSVRNFRKKFNLT